MPRRRKPTKPIGTLTRYKCLAIYNGVACRAQFFSAGTPKQCPRCQAVLAFIQKEDISVNLSSK